MTNPPKKLLFLATEDWYFCSHRLPLAIAARAQGYDVTVACRVTDHEDDIRAAGLKLEPLQWSRERGNVLSHAAALKELVLLYRRIRPEIVHHIALKPIIFGAFAAQMAGRPRIIAAVAGLGLTFTIPTLPNRLKRRMIIGAIRLLHIKTKTIFLFQNNDDREQLMSLGATGSSETAIVRGAGVDTSAFCPSSSHSREKPPIFAIVSRMLRIKGIADAVEASRRLSETGVRHALHLYGDPDKSNPASFTQEELTEFANAPSVRLFGHTNDSTRAWASADIGMQPSWGGEGLPKSLLEAAATGLPLIGTDVPGCREVVDHTVTGFLVPPRDLSALVDAMTKLATDPQLRMKMGAAARESAVQNFDATIAIERTLDLYHK